jgi:Holliday junction resolvase RusA-like endonuclease
VSGLAAETSHSDRARVVDLLSALGCTGEAVVLTVAGNPAPKPRPRFGQGRVRASEGQKRAERMLGRVLRDAFREPLEGNLGLVGLFYRDSRRVVDRDNLDKLVSDAGNGIVFTDDCQVTAGAQLLELDRGNPRTVIGVAPHDSTLTR